MTSATYLSIILSTTICLHLSDVLHDVLHRIGHMIPLLCQGVSYSFSLIRNTVILSRFGTAGVPSVLEESLGRESPEKRIQSVRFNRYSLLCQLFYQSISMHRLIETAQTDEDDCPSPHFHCECRFDILPSHNSPLVCRICSGPGAFSLPALYKYTPQYTDIIQPLMTFTPNSVFRIYMTALCCVLHIIFNIFYYKYIIIADLLLIPYKLYCVLHSMSRKSRFDREIRRCECIF